MSDVKLKLIRASCKTPAKATDGSSGFDLFSAETVIIPRGGTTKVPCGFSMEMPKWLEAQVRSRSGLTMKGLRVYNSPGTIDSDYRGEVMALMHYQPPRYLEGVGVDVPDSYKVEAGQAIAQMVFAFVPEIRLSMTDALTETKRGLGGFGSTDKS